MTVGGSAAEQGLRDARRFLDGWRADCSFGAEATRPGAEVTRPFVGRERPQNPRSQGNATSEVLFLRPEYRVHRVGVGEISHRPDPTIVVVTLSRVIELA